MYDLDMNDLCCDNPKIIIHPNSVHWLYQYKVYYFRGVRRVVKGRCISSYTYTHFFIFSPKRNEITKEDIDTCFIIDEKTGVTYPIYMLVPCGHCPNCILSKQNSFVHRCKLETQLYDVKPWFVTLTYNKKHLPLVWFPSPVYADVTDPDRGTERKIVGYRSACVPTLCKRDVQLFLKRLRINLERKFPLQNNQLIRYSVCGEYGKKSRPHYHLIIWNIQSHNRAEYKDIYDIINMSWNNGFIKCRLVDPVDDLCFKYTTKYLRKPRERQHMPKPHYDTFLFFDKEKCIKNFLATRKPFVEGFDNVLRPYLNSSNRHGGIGAPFLDKYRDDLINPHALFLNKWSQKCVKLEWSSYVINRLVPSYARLVPASYRNAVRELLYYAKWDNVPCSSDVVQSLRDEFGDTYYLAPLDNIPMYMTNKHFDSYDDCLTEIKRWRNHRNYVAPTEAMARHVQREAFLNSVFSNMDKVDLSARRHFAEFTFSRSEALEVL